MPPSPSDPVAVIGASGALGFGLAVRLAAARVPIAIGSRDETRAQETAERARATIPGGPFSANQPNRTLRCLAQLGHRAPVAPAVTVRGHSVGQAVRT